MRFSHGPVCRLPIRDTVRQHGETGNAGANGSRSATETKCPRSTGSAGDAGDARGDNACGTGHPD